MSNNSIICKILLILQYTSHNTLPACGCDKASSCLFTGFKPKSVVMYIELKPVILSVWLPVLLVVMFQRPAVGFFTATILASFKLSRIFSPFSSVNKLPSRRKYDE